jgi:hypothetical protein
MYCPQKLRRLKIAKHLDFALEPERNGDGDLDRLRTETLPPRADLFFERIE